MSDDLRVTRLHDTSDGEPDVEALWLSVGGAGRAQVVVGAIYRPPGTLTARLRGAVRKQFEMALAAGKPVYALDDFNVNLLDANAADTVYFRSLLRDFNMTQLITEPTHPHPVPSLLDLVITNVSTDDAQVSVLPNLITDHFPIVVRPSAPRARRPPITVCSRPWDQVDWDLFAADILNTDWRPFYAAADVNDKLAIFMCVWDAVADVHCPVMRKTMRRPACPWLRDEVRLVMAERDAARFGYLSFNC